MKHCAKKLLGLAFALALCLAVGGTAFAAQAPEFADVPAALPEQEMLAFEPNVTAEPGMKTVTGDGYTVTIPTTVEVKSTTDTGTLEVKGELEVTAVMKQWRTLSIIIEPQTPSKSDAWTLKYNGNASAGTTLPQVEYNLPYIDGEYDENRRDFKWLYQNEYKQLSFYTQKLGGVEDVSQTKTITAKLAVTVPKPEQATMSGTYSDTLTFRITPDKTCVTYNINVYEQKLQLTNSGTHVEAVDVVDANGNVIGNPTPKLTKTFEYPLKDEDNTWTYSSNDPEDDKLRWEELPTVTMNAHKDNQEGRTSVTFNLNLVRKWYWLDVNGATDYAGGSDEESNGNQGGKISGFVNMQVSADNGTTWSDWFWQEPGDDYWGQFPYGIRFRLGLHHVKNGYVYEMVGNGVKIIANKKETETKPGQEEGDTTYYVYEGKLTGEPTGKDSRNNVRYCYIPCYKKGLTYMANGGTGGTESVNDDNPPRSNVPYDETGTLESPEQLKIKAPAGKSFAGWSTKPTYTEGETLYQPDEPVSSVQWDGVYEGKLLSERPNYHGAPDTQKRELYAIWGDKKVTTTTGSTTPQPGPNRAPAKKALTLCYHANFDPMEELELDLDPNPLLEDMDDTFGFDPDPLPEGMDDAFGVDPDPQPKGMDDAFGVDPDPQPEELDDAFGV